jgi:hypothetical protein
LDFNGDALLATVIEFRLLRTIVADVVIRNLRKLRKKE